MNSCANSYSPPFSGTYALLCVLACGVLYISCAENLPASATTLLYQNTLSSESIASNAMNVAESTRTTGRCYAAVSKALRPLGVELSGAAAYQAQALLLADRRFVPITIHSVNELRRGDIVVYTRSSSHPYGHIAVYQGNFEEASDHVAMVTHTQAYGSATVFRLRQQMFDNNSPQIAPDYQRPYSVEPNQTAMVSSTEANSAQNRFGQQSPLSNGFKSNKQPTIASMLRKLNRAYEQAEGQSQSIQTKSAARQSLLKRCVHYLMD